MIDNDELVTRLTELEIRCVWQEELLTSLNDTVARLQDTLALQQEQLRILYKQQQQNGEVKPYSLIDELPPHY